MLPGDLQESRADRQLHLLQAHGAFVPPKGGVRRPSPAFLYICQRPAVRGAVVARPAVPQPVHAAVLDEEPVARLLEHALHVLVATVEEGRGRLQGLR